ncbi:RND family transporter [Aquiflexum sp.]|uniref:efflux RND transporter permease subunit n=1 Tax=Aquiflexum sp. TaxID=1872584 RepID=UPI0035936D47
MGKWIKKYSLAIIGLVFGLSAYSLFLLPKLKIDSSFDQFFPTGHPSLSFYRDFVEEMGTADNSMIIAIKNQPSIFDSVFLKRVEIFLVEMDSLPEIKSVSSILSIKKYNQVLPGKVSSRPYIQVSHPERFARDSVLIFSDFLFNQHFISEDASVLKFPVQLVDSLSLDRFDNLLNKIDQLGQEVGFGKIHMMGRKYMESEFQKLTKKEMKTALVLSFGVIILALYLIHRTLMGVIVPITCILLSLLMLYGYLSFFGRPLTIMSNLFPTIVLIVGISDIIHICTKFSIDGKTIHNPILAMDRTLKEIGLITLINSLTTAAGFLMLLTMSMQALRTFGVDATVGLAFAWMNSIFLLPAFILFFNLESSFIKPVQSKKFRKPLHILVDFTLNYPKQIILVFSLIVMFSLLGMWKINTNNMMLTNLPEHNRLYEDFVFFDQELGGGRSVELSLKAKTGKNFFDDEILQSVSEIEHFLEKEVGVSQIVGPAVYSKWLHLIVDRNSNWSLPSEDDISLIKLYSQSSGTALPVKIISKSGSTARIYGRIKDLGRKKAEAMEESFELWKSSVPGMEEIEIVFTGIDHLTDIGHQLRIDNMYISFIMLVIVVSVITGILYKSWKLILVALIANLIPVLVVGGVLGFTGIEMRGTTTIIFTVGFVIAVDDTLHFLHRYKLEIKNGLSLQEAINKTILETGIAMTMTSLILLGGFMVLLFSSFGDIYYHGFLVSIVILVAIITDLVLTPVLISSFFKNELDKIKKV